MQDVHAHELGSLAHIGAELHLLARVVVKRPVIDVVGLLLLNVVQIDVRSEVGVARVFVDDLVIDAGMALNQLANRFGVLVGLDLID